MALIGMILALMLSDPAPQPARPVRIEVAGFAFDPLGAEPAIPRSLRADPNAARGWWLVQLHSPPDRAARAALTSRLMLSLRRYVPENAYLEWLDSARVPALRADPRVRAVVAFHPAYKLSPALRARITGSADVVVDATIDPGDDAVARLHAAGAENVTAYRGRYRLRIAAGRLPEIARIDAVRWIEPPPRPDEDEPRQD